MTERRSPDAMLFRQWCVEGSATVHMHETTVPTSFELLTATSARLVDFFDRNINIKYSRSAQICPKRAVRPDIYCSCTWLCPLCVPSGESTHKPGLPARLVYRRRLHARAKLNGIGSTHPGGVQILTRFELQPGAGKEERCGAFAASQQKCEISSTSYLCPRAPYF